MRYGVNANQFRLWVGLPHWHASEPVEPTALSTIEITVGEVSVRVSGSVNLRALPTVIEALRA